MQTNQLADQDFERAVSKAFWRKILTWLKGENNELFQYDEIKQRVSIRGQHYIGMKQVELDKIVGSMGRYKDFDRAFLPTQKRTKKRWVSIDRAHYEEVPLSPIELYKMGEIYFVKDGNHRVSVARERGQVYIDAYVTEIDIPFVLTADMSVSELAQKQAHAEFMEATRLNDLRPEAQIQTTFLGLYDRLLDHISVHRWYLGVQKQAEVLYDQAVTSWFDQVYLPVIEVIREHNLLKSFKLNSEADLYLWLMEYQGYLRMAYSAEGVGQRSPEDQAASQLVSNYPLPSVRKLLQVVKRTDWFDNLALQMEQTTFYDQTHILTIRPQANIKATLPGQYGQLWEHISTHRWYLGEQRKQEVSLEEAVASWYDNVYMPVIEFVREQGIMDNFPERTETDLYLWIIKHQWYLKEAYGDDISLKHAAEKFTEEHSSSN